MKRDKLRTGLIVFLVVCLVAVGFRVLRPLIWPAHETVKQSNQRTFNENSFFW